MALGLDTSYCFEDSPFRKKLFSPLKAKGFVPQKHSEIFVSGIPHEATVHDLKNFFEKAGNIFQVKLMTRDDGKNRGFAYVTFMDSLAAQKALTTLKKELFLGKAHLNLRESIDNCRIFIGGLPLDKSKDEIWQELQKIYNIQNIVDVIAYRHYANPSHNRGFVFLEFRTHEEASYFRAKYWDKLVLFGKPMKVCWALPTQEVSEEVLNRVKILFVRNLDVLQTPIEYAHFIHQFMEKRFIEKIYKFKNYAYIHLYTRENAELLLNKLKDFYQGTPIEVSFANPPNKFTDKNFRDKTLIARQSNINNIPRPPLRPITNRPSPSTSRNILSTFTTSSMSSLPSTFGSPLSFSSTFGSSPSSPIQKLDFQNQLFVARPTLNILRTLPIYNAIGNIPRVSAGRVSGSSCEQVHVKGGLNDADFEDMVDSLLKD